MGLSQKIATLVNALSPGFRAYGVGTELYRAGFAGQPFFKQVTLAKGDSAGQILLTDDEVGAGRKAYVMGFSICLTGATAWTDVTATKLTIRDNNSSPVVIAEAAKAQLTANARLLNAVTGITLGAGIQAGALTAEKGIKIIPDAVFAAGSDIVAAVWGYIQ